MTFEDDPPLKPPSRPNHARPEDNFVPVATNVYRVTKRGMTLLSKLGIELPYFTGKDEAGNPVRVSANGRAAFQMGPQEATALKRVYPSDGSRNEPSLYGLGLQAMRFPGGDVQIPEPTRAALLLSARQWATAVREHFQDQFASDYTANAALMLGKFDRLDAVLAELAAMEAK